MDERKKIIINKEDFHSRAFSKAERFAWESSPEGRCLAAIIEPDFRDEPIKQYASPEEAILDTIFDSDLTDDLAYKCIGSFWMPNRTIELCEKMARYTMAMSSLVGRKVIGLDRELPPATFWLSELLYAAYPRNTDTGIIKGTMGGYSVTDDPIDPEDADDPLRKHEYEEYADHLSFAGLGVIMMREVRQELKCFLHSDHETLKEADRRELCLAFYEEQG